MKPTRKLLVSAVALAFLGAGCTADTGRSATSRPSGQGTSSEATAEPSAAPSSTSTATSTATAQPQRPGRDSVPGRVGRWRTEVWRDVQLRVPSSWWLGYAPMSQGAKAKSCGVGPQPLERDALRPYVGRPGYGSDTCLLQDPEEVVPQGPAVWFDSPLKVGTVAVKPGLRATTVEVGDSRVTVAGRPGRDQQRILGSVRTVAGVDANGCDATPRVEREVPDEQYGEPLSISVCLYDRGKAGEPRLREWSTGLPSGRAARFLAALERARPARSCDSPSPQLLVLRILTVNPTGAEPLRRDFVVRPSGCAALESPAGGESGRWVQLTPALVSPWALAGVGTYVVGNGLPSSLDRFFRPVWG